MNRRRVRSILLTAALTSAFLVAWASPGIAQSWAPLLNLTPDSLGAGTMLLLTDGSVMVQGGGSFGGANWMRLVPDPATGDYVKGTWSNLASMSTGRLFFASEILTSGKVWVLGGELAGAGIPPSGGSSATGEVYDPLANTWSGIASYPPEPGCPSGCFADDPSMLLPGGMIIAGDIFNNMPHLYNIATDTWSSAGPKIYNDKSDEEGWVKLADGSVLTYDIWQSLGLGLTNCQGSQGMGMYAEKYTPATNTWSGISPSDGTANGFIPQLSSVALDCELGPVLRLQDGRIFILGATGHTALYTSSTNTWSAGPDIMGTLSGGPALFGADDAPGAVMPNGHVLFAADAGPALGVFSHPTQIFDFDPGANTISPVSPSIPDARLASISALGTRMLVLPTGQVLVNDASPQLYVYTSAGAPNPALRPSITSVSYSGGGVFTLGGQQLNGQSAGSNYGDDVESDENFPIVRLSNTAGQVFYARTTNWSTTEVATGATPETVNFTLPATLTTPGTYSLQDVGAGMGSFPVYLSITAAEIAGL